jgi:hypothetical protein
MFFLKKKIQPSLGALIDTRPVEEKQKDYLFSEIVAGVEPVNWVEKKEWRRFPVFNQDGSSGCVAFSLAKILGVMHQVNEGEWVTFSPGFIYQQRANKPQPGMIGVDAFEIVRKNGALLEELFPSQNKSDEELDSYQVKNYEKEIAAVFGIDNYVILPTRDIDTIASVIQKTGKAVMAWYFWNVDEYNRPEPIIQDFGLTPSLAQGRHSVSVVDFTLKDGKKYLVIDDSWGVNTGINGQRLISEDFHRARNFFAAYPINFRFDVYTAVKPSYVFTKNLYYGTKNDPDVKALQDALKYFGTFPINAESTGSYFGLTAKAVYDWQTKYKIASQDEIDALGGKVFGPKSIKVMNELLK